VVHSNVIASHLTHPSLFLGLRGVIFDCDGVLFDSKASNTAYYNAVLAKLDLPPMGLEQEGYCHSHTARDSLLHIVPPRLHDRILDAVAQVNYRRDILPHLAAEPGLYDLLDWLRASGVALGIATNRTTTMDWVVDRFQLGHYFSPIMHAGKARSKPHPEMLHAALRQWGMRRDEAAFVGDTSVDEAAAHAAGVPFWAYKGPGLRARLHVGSYWQLRQALHRAFATEGR